MLRRCCSTCRGSVAALLQHASWQRCCSSRRCGTVATGAATLLQQALRQRCGTTLARVAATLRCCCCGAVAARSNDEKQRTMQRWQADGRWPTSKFLFFFKMTVSKREREQNREKRDKASKLVSRLCWLASSFLSTPSFNVNSL